MKDTAMIFRVFAGTILLVQNIIASEYVPGSEAGWETISPVSLNWNTASLDSLSRWLDSTRTRGMIILKGGRIAYEHYGPDITMDSVWYWASAGKSLCAFLIGTAQEAGLLHVDSSTSRYLGSGWSSLSTDREKKITLLHQLTMTAGLNDTLTIPGVADVDNCLKPECLEYLAEPGTRWAYHNAPYRLLHVVLDSVYAKGHNAYTTEVLKPAGFKGLWINHVMYSTPRSMARFGLVILRKGVWGTDTLLHDSAYFHSMVSRSQTINQSYGYLWWLNGQNSFMLPDLQRTFTGPCISNAPSDMIMALGKNDQKIHVIPSLDLVIVRMGEAYQGAFPVPIQFDYDLWKRLNMVFAGPVSVKPGAGTTTNRNVFAIRNTRLYCAEATENPVRIITPPGKTVYSGRMTTDGIDLAPLSRGVYLIQQGSFKTAFALSR